MISRQQLVDAYADWLSNYKWDWFGTLTFPGFPSEKRAKNKFDRWIRQLEQAVGTTGFRYVQVLERGAYGDNIHFHILIGGLKRSARPYPNPWAYQWSKIAGHAALSQFDPEQGGVYYLLKTLLPGRAFDVDIHIRERATEKGPRA